MERNGRKQFLIDTNIGKGSWEEWHEWIEGINDDLPDPEGLIDTWGNLPELAPPLIEGLLRQGHKMLMAGPSKAGKSFALIELSIAIAEGRQWLGWDCTQGKILYVNLELDRASALHRFEDVYAGLGYAPNNVENIDVWNLRGKSVPMDKLAPKLIRRAQKKNYIAVIIDPIYKVLTGDENSADQMAHFTNQFDKIATELGCSVIYCHHHSKGTQGGKKSMDRASGSGVFARDPDALIDLVELEITDKLLRSMQETEACEQYAAAMEEHNFDYFDEHVSGPDLENAFLMKNHATRAIPEHIEEVEYSINQALKSFSGRSAWRVEGTLREYAKFETKNMWFEYPIHKIDESGVLNEVEPEGNLPPWKNAIAKRKDPETKKEERIKSFETAFQVLDDGQTPVTIGTMAEYMGVSKKTVRRRLDEAAEFKAVPVQNEETRVERKG